MSPQEEREWGWAVKQDWVSAVYNDVRVCVCADLDWGVNLQSRSSGCSEAPQTSTEEILCGRATHRDPYQ